MAGRARARTGAVASLLAALAIAGCGGADETGPEAAASTTGSEATTAAGQGPTGAQGQQADATDAGSGAAGAGKPQVYFTAGEQSRKVDRDLPSGSGGPRAALDQLLAGPADGERAQTQIPAKVGRGRVTTDADGTATVELPAAFLAGVPAAAGDRDDRQRQELAARLGQLTYTVTQFDGVESVRIVVGGEPVEQRVGRADYAAPSQARSAHSGRRAIRARARASSRIASPTSSTCRAAPSTGSTATAPGRR